MSQDIAQQLSNAIDRLAGARVGVIGDLVADRYVSGQSERVSREAPVLIVQYEKEWIRPGGAANVAANIAALGATVCVAGIVGDDPAGRGLLKLVSELGTTAGGTVRCEEVLVHSSRETITKTRFLAGARHTSRQQILRVDRQPLQSPSDDLRADLRRQIERLDSHVDAWIASDYGYGSFDDSLRGLLREIAQRKPVLADSRWELHRFRGMTVVKPNEEEARATVHMLNLPTELNDADLAAALERLLEARAAVVTLGNKGMVLSQTGDITRIPTAGSEEIVDLTGAGDSVAATLVTALASGASVVDACRLANYAGGVVVMKEGAATASRVELIEAIRHGEHDA